MLFITNIDDCTFKIHGDSIYSTTGVRILNKKNFLVKIVEPAVPYESVGRVTIYDGVKQEKLVTLKPLDQIDLNGTVHPTGEAFAVAFNTMIAQCCCGGSSGESGYNTAYDCPYFGSIESTTGEIPADTYNSVTIIVETGTVNIDNGDQNVDLVEGETVTFTASGTIATAIAIDATEGKAIWIAMGECAGSITTTTTTVAVTTTTTTIFMPL